MVAIETHSPGQPCTSSGVTGQTSVTPLQNNHKHHLWLKNFLQMVTTVDFSHPRALRSPGVGVAALGKQPGLVGSSSSSQLGSRERWCKGGLYPKMQTCCPQDAATSIPPYLPPPSPPPHHCPPPIYFLINTKPLYPGLVSPISPCP